LLDWRSSKLPAQLGIRQNCGAINYARSVLVQHASVLRVDMQPLPVIGYANRVGIPTVPTMLVRYYFHFQPSMRRSAGAALFAQHRRLRRRALLLIKHYIFVFYRIF